MRPGNIIQEAPLPVCANFRQRALDTAMVEITKRTEISIAIIAIDSLERSKHRRVTTVIFAIRSKRCRAVIRLSEVPEVLLHSLELCLANV
jgi:hypothetical protein